MPGADILIYTKQWCPYCAKTKALLRAKNLEWRELDVTFDERLQQEMVERSGRRSVPEVFLEGTLVGGYDDLARLNATGELDRRLGREPVELKTLYDIAIVGGGNSALEAALEMDGIAGKVHLVARSGLTGDQVLEDKIATAPGIEVLPHHEPVEITGADAVESLTVLDREAGTTTRLAVQGVFVEIGLFPNTGFALDLVDTNERGEIIVDSHCRTGVRGLFAAGDCTDTHDKQIVISVGEGAKAALAAFEYLVAQV